MYVKTACAPHNASQLKLNENTSKMGLPVHLWIDNTNVISSVQFPVLNASTGQVVHNAYGATPEIAIAAVDSAQKAFLSWSKTTPWERRKLFKAAAHDLRRQREEVGALLRVCLPPSSPPIPNKAK